MASPRRLVDVAVAAAALAVLSPVLAVVGLLIRFSSPGPVVYRARRVGLHGQTFTIFKFRTMRTEADGGGAITASGDPRVYPLGSWLRRHKVDELPQLVNVLRGEMSLIGPRPEDPQIVATHYRDEHLLTLDVRPGLTSPGSLYNCTHGEAMLTGPDPDTAYAAHVLPVKLALDLVYLRRGRGVGQAPLPRPTRAA
jgi:lipopolysaccharide/colanic/teichoic acid biosynthesis glycosyltransferase